MIDLIIIMNNFCDVPVPIVPTTSASRPLRPGDVIRVGHGFPLRRAEEEAVDYLRIHFETRSPGLARVVAVTDDGMLVTLWGHRFLTTRRADDPALRRLGRLALALAPERLGEAILDRELRIGGAVVEAAPSRRLRPGPTRLWLRWTRGSLPVLEALGGRIHAPLLRRMKAWSFHGLFRLGLMPAAPGFIDRGLLVDRIGRTMTLGYGRDERDIRLDRILLHKNHSLHLVGVDRAKGELRSFRLDRVWALEIPPLGEVDPDDLHWELQALCMRRDGWLWYWNRRQAERGLPPAPPIGRIARWLERTGASLWACGRGLDARARRAGIAFARRRRRAGWLLLVRYRRLRSWSCAVVQSVLWRLGPPPPPSPGTLPSRWRDRLQRALAVVESGGTEQITALLPMNRLLVDPVGCHAWLRHMLEHASKTAPPGNTGHPDAPALLAEALALMPVLPSMPGWERRRAAALALSRRLDGAQPGHRRIWVRATRPAGRDSRLLLCGHCLSAAYHLNDTDAAGRLRPWTGLWPPTPKAWSFYRANAYFVARWDDARFRVDAASAPRLRMIIAWWDARSPQGRPLGPLRD